MLYEPSYAVVGASLVCQPFAFSGFLCTGVQLVVAFSPLVVCGSVAKASAFGLFIGWMGSVVWLGLPWTVAAPDEPVQPWCVSGPHIEPFFLNPPLRPPQAVAGAAYWSGESATEQYKYGMYPLAGHTTSFPLGSVKIGFRFHGFQWNPYPLR